MGAPAAAPGAAPAAGAAPASPSSPAALAARPGPASPSSPAALAARPGPASPSSPAALAARPGPASPSSPAALAARPGPAPGPAPARVGRLLGDARRGPRSWAARLGLLLAAAGAAVFVLSAVHTVRAGVGAWGNSNSVGWGLGVVHFVWWIGIAHAGTFLSAILLLAGARWRTPLHRVAETMTLLAVGLAAAFILLHLGRPWRVSWMLPWPGLTGVWPQPGSPLVWDAAAIAAYAIVSVLFWWVGMLPDLAALRDRARGGGRRVLLALAALGWRGSGRHWRHHRATVTCLAGLAAPLVVSVHSVVSMDFASVAVPGWHSTILPLYFVAGAIFSGLAMVITIVVPLRRWLDLEDVITGAHLDRLGALLLAGAWLVLYAAGAEAFLAWYGGEAHAAHLLLRVRPGSPAFAVLVVGGALAPQILWWPAARRRGAVLVAVAVAVNAAMWAERYLIVVTSQARGLLPSAWTSFRPTWTDVGLFVGSLGVFALLILLLLGHLPPVARSELEEQAALEAEPAGAAVAGPPALEGEARP